jgi:hypothetical protein
VIKRTLTDEQNTLFVVDNLSKNQKITSQLDVDAMVSVVSQLDFIQSLPSKDKKLDKSKAVKTIYQLDGGLSVLLSIWQESKGKDQGYRYWLSVDYDVASPEHAEALTPVTSKLAQYKGWIYEIGGYQGSLLTKTLPQLIQK